MMRNILFSILVRPFILFVLGLNIRHYERLPAAGPCVIIANHNSHLDTLVLMSLFKGRSFRKVRPVAAGDYFLKNRYLGFFSTKVMNIDRKSTRLNSSHVSISYAVFCLKKKNYYNNLKTL